MTIQDLRIQFHRETGHYAPIDNYDYHTNTSISEKDYIKWLEEKLVDDENYREGLSLCGLKVSGCTVLAPRTPLFQ